MRAPSAFSITLACLPSMTATHELVVPRSIPMTAPRTGPSDLPSTRRLGSRQVTQETQMWGWHQLVGGGEQSQRCNRVHIIDKVLVANIISCLSGTQLLLGCYQISCQVFLLFDVSVCGRKKISPQSSGTEATCPRYPSPLPSPRDRNSIVILLPAILNDKNRSLSHIVRFGAPCYLDEILQHKTFT